MALQPQSSFGSLGFPHVQLGVRWKDGVNKCDKSQKQTFTSCLIPWFWSCEKRKLCFLCATRSSVNTVFSYFTWPDFCFSVLLITLVEVSEAHLNQSVWHVLASLNQPHLNTLKKVFGQYIVTRVISIASFNFDCCFSSQEYVVWICDKVMLRIWSHISALEYSVWTRSSQSPSIAARVTQSQKITRSWLELCLTSGTLSSARFPIKHQR